MTTKIQEVPREQWGFFLDIFSRQHAGWPVTVEIAEHGGGARIEGDGVPFEGITFDSGEKGGPSISVMLGGRADRHVAHTIAAPEHVYLDRRGLQQGRGESLEIVADDGAKTFVRFERPILPEEVDGLL